MRELTLVLLFCFAGCNCRPETVPYDGGDGGGGGGSGGSGEGGGAAGGSGLMPTAMVSANLAQPSIALDLAERPQILGTRGAPILARWTGTSWQLDDLRPDAAVGSLYDGLTLSIDTSGVRHMSWTHQTGTIEYGVLDDAGLRVFPVYRAGIMAFGGVPSSPRDRSGAPVVGYIQMGSMSELGTHVARQTADGGFTNTRVECCTTRNVSVAVTRDGDALLGYQGFDAPNGLHFASPLSDAGYGWESVSVAQDGEISMVLDSSDRPNIVFQRDGALHFATRDGGGWSLEQIEPAPSGEFAELALAPDGTPRVVFTAGTRGDAGVLLLGRRGATGWAVQVIGPYAFWPTLAVDSRGTSHVAYDDVYDGGLRYVAVP